MLYKIIHVLPKISHIPKSARSFFTFKNKISTFRNISMNKKTDVRREPKLFAKRELSGLATFLSAL